MQNKSECLLLLFWQRDKFFRFLDKFSCNKYISYVRILETILQRNLILEKINYLTSDKCLLSMRNFSKNLHEYHENRQRFDN